MEGIPVAEILTSHANVAEALAMIEFVASDHVVEVAADVYQNTMPGHLALTRAVRKVEDVTSLSGGNYTERVEMVARLIEAFRQDLGTSGATMVDLDPSN
ncbi:hypothetical protein LX88_008419 [Lentzea californiensis]|nr:hypothetical protein [Lentzea californiensis]